MQGSEATDLPAGGESGSAGAVRFWRGFNQYDHGRCWFAEEDEEEGGGVAMEWNVRGPARFEAEWERALRTGGSRLAAKAQRPYGDAGVCGRAAYALQLLACLYALAEQVEGEARERAWDLTVGVLAYREAPGGEEDEEDEEMPEAELVTELDPEELAACETLVLWAEVELPEAVDDAGRLGDAFGRFMSRASGWFERLDAGDREAVRSVPRLRG